MDNEITLMATPTSQITAQAAYSKDDFLGQLLESLDRSPRTVDSYRKGVKYFFLWLDEQGIDTPTRADLKRYKDHLIDSHKISTAALYLSAIRWLYKAIAEESGKPELNIAQGIRVPKPPKGHQKDALSAEQIKSILSSMPTNTLTQKRDRAMLAIMPHCALRVIEVTRADVGDIRNTPRGAVLDIWGKGRDGKVDFIPVDPEALAIVNDYLKAREDKDGKLNPLSPLFVSVSPRDYGQRMTTRSVSRICKQVLREYILDSPRLTAHSLRHSAINILIQKGASLYEAQQYARHKNPSTTEIYIHENESTLWDASSRIGDALSL